MGRSIAIHGTVHPRFGRVEDAFAANLSRRGGIGASLCVIQDGETVVDLWGGLADVETGRPWEADTLAVVFSCTKGLLATCLLLLHDRGLLDHDAPVARYWPEFAANGKERVTVRTLLAHRAGLLGLDADPSLDDLEDADAMAALVARQPLAWPPGARQGYHGVTFGLFAAELVRRISGRSPGRFLADELTGPLGADVFLGLPPSEEHRVATLYPATRLDRLTKILPRALFAPTTEGRVYRSALFDPQGPTRTAFAHPSVLGLDGVQNFNSPRVHRMELGWAGAIASARGLARFYTLLACEGQSDGVRRMSEATARLPRARHSFAYDAVLHRQMGFTLGFVKEDPGVFGPEPAAFGHPGAGGALGWCDPTRRLAIGYVPNRMDFRIRSRRALAICDALYRCL